MKVLLKVAYDGSNYHGWQFQEGLPTIEGEILKALNDMVGKPVEIMGASRTDAGVHALGNLAVFDTDSSIPEDKFIYGLNNRLPRDIRIVESSGINDEFDIRHDIKNKTYEYKITTNKVLLPHKRLYYYHYNRMLDVEAMNHGAELLVGEHDFTSFSSVNTQTLTRVRNIYFCEVFSDLDDIIIRVNGSGFLYNMVRIIAGTLLEVGKGKIAPEDIKGILAGRDRNLAGATLPPQGLTLVEIFY